MLKHWTQAPIFEDRQLEYTGRIVRAAFLCLLILVPINTLLSVVLRPDTVTRAVLIGLTLIGVSAGLLAVNRVNPRLAGGLGVTFFWLIATWAVATSGGTQSVSVYGYFVALIFGTLVFGVRTGLAILCVIAATLFMMALVEIDGLLPARQIIHTPLSAAVAWTFGLAIMLAALGAVAGAVRGYLGEIGDEMEARRAAEAALKGRVGQLEFVHHSAGLASWVWDIAADKLELFGDPGTVMGLPAGSSPLRLDEFLSRVHPDDQRAARKRMRDGLKGLQRSYTVQDRVLLPDGDVRWVEVIGRFEYGADGRAVRMAGVFRDITEQRRAHEAVANSERRYRGLFDSALDGIAIVDPEGKLLDVNSAYCQDTGFARDELVGRPFAALIPAEDTSAQPVALGTLDRRRSIMVERRLQRKHGGQVPVEIHAWQLPDGNTQAIVRDISERKRAEERFAKIFHVGPGAVTISRLADGKYLEVNDVWQRWSGYTREEAIGRTSADIKIWVDLAERARLLEALQCCDSIRNFESKFRRKSGDIADIVLAAELLELDGELHLVTSIDDVTERRRAENALRLHQAKIESIFRCSPLGIGDVVDRRLTLVNERFCELLGYTAEEIIGVNARMLYPSDEEFERAGRELYRPLKDTGIGQVETQLRRKDGSVIDVLISISPILASDPGGEATTIVQDITAQKRSSQALEAANARLRTLSRKLLEAQETERRSIARELHDEIGQALTAMKFKLHGLTRLSPDAETSSQIASCMEIADAALHQVRDLSLNLRPPQLELMGLEAALRWLLTTRVEALGLKTELSARLGTAGRAPQIDITCFRVVQEALTNAIRHARATILRVDIEQDDEAIEITVRDNGTGFDTAAARNKAAAGGSLGLMSMEERLSLLGGSFELTSEPGAGTRVRGRIPLAPAGSTKARDKGGGEWQKYA